MKKNTISPFVQLVWNIVQDPNYKHIVNWSTNGTSFCIVDPQTFAHDILSHHFKHGNISSFVRQLNMYNFHKNKHNTKDLQFFHKLFRRDAREILVGIKRKPSEMDQIQGEALLRAFLMRKQTMHLQVKSQSQNEILKEDQKAENTTMEQLTRKFPTNYQQPRKETQNTEYYNFPPKKILNIILVNRTQEI